MANVKVLSYPWASIITTRAFKWGTWVCFWYGTFFRIYQLFCSSQGWQEFTQLAKLLSPCRLQLLRVQLVNFVKSKVTGTLGWSAVHIKNWLYTLSKYGRSGRDKNHVFSSRGTKSLIRVVTYVSVVTKMYPRSPPDPRGPGGTQGSPKGVNPKLHWIKKGRLQKLLGMLPGGLTPQHGPRDATDTS